MSNPNLPTTGQAWVYKQSLRTYLVIDNKDGDVTYTAATMSPSYGKVFKRSLSHFLETFTPPEKVTDETVLKAVENTLRVCGILK